MSKPKMPDSQHGHGLSERPLRADPETLATLMHLSPHAVVGLDRDGNVMFWNAAAETLFDWPSADVMGRPLPILSDGAMDRFRANFNLVLNGETIRDLEVRDVRQDGSPVDLLIYAMPMKDQDGQVTGIMAALKDITELTRAEESIRVLARFPEENPNPVMRIGADGILLYANLASAPLREAWGCKTGAPVPESVAAVVSEVLETKRPQEILVEPKGATWGVEVTPIPGEDYVNLYCRDITERKKAEEELIRTNEMLSAVISSSPLPINMLDCNGNVTLWNTAAEAVFGWSEAEAVGRFLPIVPAAAKDEFLANVSLVKNGETLKGKEVRRMRRDGSLLDLRVWAAPLRDQDGKAIGSVSVLDDMTERKQLQAQLRQSQRLEAVGRLAGGVAHEFKNLLMGMSGLAEILQMKLGRDHPQFETANDLLQCADRAAKLIGKLQAFGRRQSLEIRPTDVNELVSESKHFLEHLLGEHIEMTLDLSGEPAIANVDPGQIEQVLTNLAINARDAMPTGGSLVIKTRNVLISDAGAWQSLDLNQDGYIEISVTDTGSGMSEATLNQVFEPFFTTKGSDGRMGLGLSVTYGIVRQHKGSIDVRSRPGEGSSFIVYLPAAEQVSACDDKQATYQPKGGTETILLAEDEDIVRMPVKSLLEAYGYTVLDVGDGEEAIKVFERNVGKIDLAVLDVVMPKAGGKQVWEAIREIRPDMKVLFMSGHATAEVHEDFMPPSNLTFLTKPFSVLSLANKIREILD